MSKVRFYREPSKAEKEAAERAKAEIVGLTYDEWCSLDEKSRASLMNQLDAAKKKAARMVRAIERERHYAEASNMTVEEWRGLDKEKRREKKSEIDAADKRAKAEERKAQEEERKERQLIAEAKKLKREAEKPIRKKAAKNSPFQAVAGATRLSLITGLMDSPTNKKWESFLYQGPYWNYLVNYITTKKIFGGRKDLVEEAVQLAITKIGKFMVSKQYKYHEEGKGFFRGFIKKVAYRAALDVFRQNMRYEKVSDRSSPSDSDTIEKDYKKSYDNNAKKLAKMGEQVGIDSEIFSVSENDLDNYDASAGFKRNIKPEIKSGAGKKMHNIARLDSDPFTDDEMPSNYSPADIFDYLTNISKEDLKWVQKLQLHVLYIALGYVLANDKIPADHREMLRLRYGRDWTPADIYKSERFCSKTRNDFDVTMHRAIGELRKEAKSWWEMVAPNENDFADETVLNLWRKLSSDHNRAQIANDLQDKANEKAGRIG